MGSSLGNLQGDVQPELEEGTKHLLQERAPRARFPTFEACSFFLPVPRGLTWSACRME